MISSAREIPPDPNAGGHVHSLPGYHSRVSNRVLTSRDVGTLRQCPCGKWFKVVEFGRGDGVWKPVRFWDFKHLQRIQESEGSDD